MSGRRAPSVVRRITVRLVIITLAAIGLSYAWLLYQVHYAADRLAEGSLIEEAAKLARGLHLAADGVTLKVPREMRNDPAAADGNFRYSVTGKDRRILFASPWPPTPLADVRIFDTKNNLYQTSHQRPESREFYGASAKTVLAGQELDVLVERNSRDLETIMDTLLQEYFMHGAWIYVLLLLGVLIVSVLTIRGAIVPVERLSTEARTIGPRSTDLRLSEAGVPKEILGFVQAVNSALDRLAAGFQTQREFTADAAHELRTPLAVLRAHIDTLDDPAAVGELRRDVDQMTRIVAQLLRIARLDATVVAPDEGCDLREVAIEVASLAIPTALDRGKTIALRGAEGAVPAAANADLVFHAVRNLVDNAIAHSGSASPIEIVVRRDCSISVVDHGPGIPAHLRERVFHRFWRSERSGGGSGLGLSIVKRSIELCRGRVAIAETPGGGATVTLAFEAGVRQRGPADASPAARAAAAGG